MEESQPPQIPEEHLSIIFYYGAYPLWKYLQDVLDIDILAVCSRIAKEEPVLKTDMGDLVVRIHDPPYPGRLEPIYNNDVIFLINSVNTVFRTIQPALMHNDIAVLKSLNLRIDEFHNLSLVDELGLPISSKVLSVFKLSE